MASIAAFLKDNNIFFLWETYFHISLFLQDGCCYCALSETMYLYFFLYFNRRRRRRRRKDDSRGCRRYLRATVCTSNRKSRKSLGILLL
jgi:hypothetical protein